MKQIFEPVKMNHIELKNRLIRSATWEGIANPDGSVTSEAYEIYEELAKGGIDSIEVSGNGTSVAGIKAHVNEGYFVPATAKIAGAVSCPVIVYSHRCSACRNL